MPYTNTLITIAKDSPVEVSETPTSTRENTPMHIVVYELLLGNPYGHNHEQLVFESHIIHKKLGDLSREEKEVLWEKLMKRTHACLRTSPLTKKYGYGAHYDAVGNIALYPAESMVYKKFVKDKDIEKIPAMKNKK